MRGHFALAAGLAILLSATALRAQASGPYQFYGFSPCRIVDTRGANGPVGGPALSSNVSRDFPIIGYCNVPSTAKAAALNVTFIAPTIDGFIRITPAGTTSTTSNVNALAGTPAIANADVVLLTSGPNNITALYVTVQAGTANLVIDVTGYYQ
jgi:hypothetical protein